MFCSCCQRQRKKTGENAKQAFFEDYKESFKIFDKDADGSITVKEIVQTFKEMNLPLTEAEATDLVNEFDKNGDGAIGFDEFVVFMKKYLNAEETGATAMFQYFDIDGDGYITAEEFVLTMKFLGEELTPHDADLVLGKYYKGKEKKISLEDFKEIMRRYL